MLLLGLNHLKCKLGKHLNYLVFTLDPCIMKRKMLRKLVLKKRALIEKRKHKEKIPTGSIHNFFADKMARFSLVMVHITYKTQTSLHPATFEKVRQKLTTLREDFLGKYHQLSRGSGNSSHPERVGQIYELLLRFEKEFLNEIRGAGLQISGLENYPFSDVSEF